MTPDPETVKPDPRTAPDDADDATNEGVSSPAPAEGGDERPPERPGSPKG